MKVVLLLCLLGVALCQDYEQQKSWGGDCQTGENQSPINIIIKRVQACDKGQSFTLTSKDELYTQKAYDPHNENLLNPFTLSTITIKSLQDDSTKEFNSVQFHFHHTAEHRINGITHDAELHVVHKAADGSLAVMGFIFRAINGWFRDPLDSWNLDTKEDIQQKFPIRLETPRKVFHYQGSLTTPACTEGVNWFVSERLINIKRKNLNKLAKLINEGHTNNRMVQPINKRKVVEAGNVCALQNAHFSQDTRHHHLSLQE